MIRLALGLRRCWMSRLPRTHFQVIYSRGGGERDPSFGTTSGAQGFLQERGAR